MIQKEFNDFLEFFREQKVLGLAIGFLIGGALSKLVTAFVIEIVNPVAGLILGFAGDLKTMSYEVGTMRIGWGSFVSQLIDFLVIALVVYYGVKILRFGKKPEESAKKK